MNLLCRRIPNKLCRDSAFKEAEHDCPLFKYGLCIVTFLQDCSMGRGEKSNFTLEKLDKQYFSQVLKVNIKSDRSC